MTIIAILPENPEQTSHGYRAIAGDLQSSGVTVGAALDALTAKLGRTNGATLVVVQDQRPDAFFTEQQQQRLHELMGLWRTARDAGRALSPADQAELDALVEAEVRAAGLRAAELAQKLNP
jgi:hypothetical protein